MIRKLSENGGPLLRAAASLEYQFSEGGSESSVILSTVPGQKTDAKTSITFDLPIWGLEVEIAGRKIRDERARLSFEGNWEQAGVLTGLIRGAALALTTPTIFATGEDAVFRFVREQLQEKLARAKGDVARLEAELARAGGKP